MSVESAVTAPVQSAAQGGDPDLGVSGPVQGEKSAKHAYVVAVTSGKGGVGKTSISTNLSISLASRGNRVCLFDADTSLANVNILLGLSPKYTLEHYVRNESSIEDILIEAPGGVQIVPGATGIGEFINLNSQQQKHLVDGLKQLESQFDYLVIDTGAGISDPLIRFLLASPYVVVTITPEPTSLTDAFSLLKVLKRHNFSAPVFVIINMVQSRASAHETYQRFKGAVVKYLELEIYYLSFIFSDPRVSASVRAQKPYLLEYPDSHASRCLETASYLLSNVLEKKPRGKAFSEYFQSLHPDEESDEIEVLAEPRSSDAATESEQPPEVSGQSLEQTVESLCTALQEFCQSHPGEMSSLRESVMPLLEMELGTAEEESKQSVTSLESAEKPLVSGFQGESVKPEYAHLLGLKSACRFAAQLEAQES